jgi:hypothetical protein
MSVLFLVTPLKLNRKSFTNATLLNSNRVSDFMKSQQYPTTRTDLYYDAGEGERGSTFSFELNHTANTIATRMNEDDTNKVVKLNVLSYKVGTTAPEKTTASNQKIWEVGTDKIVWGYDISNTQCFLWLDRGLNWVRIKCSHTVADISRAVSTSASLSAS